MRFLSGSDFSERIKAWAFVIILLLSLFPVEGSAQEMQHPVVQKEERYFYEDAKRGWYWYEEESEKVEETTEAKGMELLKTRRVPSLKEYPVNTLWNMHPDDFQALLTDFQKKAVMHPSVENVREYLIVQDIARRKALAYANVATLVVQMNPELSLNKDYPLTAPGRVARARQQKSNLEEKILSSRDDFGLVYFYSGDCPFCDAQKNILSYFVNKYGWQIKEVEINERPDLAVSFHVKTVPFLLLIYKHSKDSIPVSVGVTSLDEIEHRLYRSIRLLRGESTPEGYSLYEFQRGGGLDPLIPQTINATE